MTLREYIDGLKKFAEENPDTLDMKVVTSEGGDNYNSVYCSPSKGIFEDRDFISAEQYEDWERDESETNAVCVN